MLLEDIEGSRFSEPVSGSVDDCCDSEADLTGGSSICIVRDACSDGVGLSTIDSGDSTSDGVSASVGESGCTEDKGLEGRNSDENRSRVRL